MVIKVIGKAHFEGKSRRTGREYNFNQVHYVGKDRGVEGLAALTLSLDPDLIPYDSIRLNVSYAVEFNNRGYVVDFTPAPAADGGK